MAGTVPAKNKLLSGTVPAKNELLAGTVPGKNKLLAEMVQKYFETNQSGIPVFLRFYLSLVGFHCHFRTLELEATYFKKRILKKEAFLRIW